MSDYLFYKWLDFFEDQWRLCKEGRQTKKGIAPCDCKDKHQTYFIHDPNPALFVCEACGASWDETEGDLWMDGDRA